MYIELSGFQFLLMVVFVIGTPILGFLIHITFKKNSNIEEENNTTTKRKLIKSETVKIEPSVFFRKIDWSALYSGWLKGKSLSFEKEKIPLICNISGLDKKGAWSQPVKMGVNPLISSSKNYLEKFGKAVITITTVSKEDTARNIGWGLASYLNVVAGRILVFEINQKGPKKKHSTRIDLGNRLFDDIPDPIPSEFNNVDLVSFDLAYTWPEDILTRELIEQFVTHYKNIYNLILIIAPPVTLNGFARKAATTSDCCILIGNHKDDQSLLIDAYHRIKYSIENFNHSMVVWGVMEKGS